MLKHATSVILHQVLASQSISVVSVSAIVVTRGTVSIQICLPQTAQQQHDL